MSHTRLVFACLWIAVPVVADEPAVDYRRDIKPILRARCYACHGALKQEAGLRLDAAELIRAGGDGGPAIEPGSFAESVLIERVTEPDESLRMPPEGRPLVEEEVALLKAWIQQGAVAPDDDRPEPPPSDHWAFQRPTRPTVPRPIDPTWRDHPIDAFIAAAREKHGLTALPRAPKSLLLRRLFLDLVGLPPSLDDLEEFRAEVTQEGVARVADRLLASPHYGERWGRHWMDVWRYTDWFGLGAQLRNSQKHIWHWRDWIIESLNADKGYDRMIVEMLAADEIAPLDRSVLRASGFLARNYYLFNRTTWLDDTVEHTSKAFLGLTLNCTKCHDHKYDPITQVDYYRMRAFFEPHQIRLDPVPGEIDLEQDGLARAFDAHLDAPTYVHIRGDAKDPDTKHLIEPGVPAVFRSALLKIKPVELPLVAHRPELRPHVLRDRLEKATQAIEIAQSAVAEKEKAASAAADDEAAGSKFAALELRVAQATFAAAEFRPEYLRALHAVDLARGRGEAATGSDSLVDAPVDAPEINALGIDALVVAAARVSQEYDVRKSTADLARAELALANAADGKKKAAEEVLEKARKGLALATKTRADAENHYAPLYASRKALEGPDETEESRRQAYPKTSTGRRTALARWIASSENPLTARVAVNHIWLRHFGQPLVESMSDFGRRAKTPPLHDLLDWLAVEFVESGWSMKRLHRLVVTSQAYALQSSVAAADEATRQADPENRFYWRRQPIRMEAQVIRDSLLSLAGVLHMAIGGRSVAPQTEEIVSRRSVYFVQSRDEQNKFLSMFDDADIFRCYRRTVSIIPQQALALANSKLALAMARQTTARLNETLAEQSNAQFVEAAFEHVLSVKPTPEETAACLETLDGMQAQLIRDGHSKAALRARQNVVHALYNHNDFITIR